MAHPHIAGLVGELHGADVSYPSSEPARKHNPRAQYMRLVVMGGKVSDRSQATSHPLRA
jgi:hypothetical protein